MEIPEFAIHSERLDAREVFPEPAGPITIRFVAIANQ